MYVGRGISRISHRKGQKAHGRGLEFPIPPVLGTISSIPTLEKAKERMICSRNFPEHCSKKEGLPLLGKICPQKRSSHRFIMYELNKSSPEDIPYPALKRGRRAIWQKVDFPESWIERPKSGTARFPVFTGWELINPLPAQNPSES